MCARDNNLKIKSMRHMTKFKCPCKDNFSGKYAEKHTKANLDGKIFVYLCTVIKLMLKISFRA